MTPAPFGSPEALLHSEEWISVPESNAVELLRDLPLASPPEATDQSEHLLLRKVRLKAIRSRIGEQRAELRREFARLETARAELEIERARLVRNRQQTAASAIRRDETPSITDEERAGRLAPNPVDAAAGPAMEPLDSEPPVAAAEEHDETSQSVTAYMERLLGRIQQLRGETDLHPHALETRGSASDGRETPAGSSAAVAAGPSAGHRRKQVVEEVRAAVEPLRALANESARAAVKKHSSRKFRRSMALIFPLMLVAFIMGAVLIRIGGSPRQFAAQAFGTTMLGVIACIALIHSYWRINHRGAAAKLRARSECDEEEVDLDDDEARQSE